MLARLFNKNDSENILKQVMPIEIILLLLEGYGFPPIKETADLKCALADGDDIYSRQPYFTLGLALRFPEYLHFAHDYAESYDVFLQNLYSDKLFHRQAFLGMWMDSVQVPQHYPPQFFQKVTQTFGNGRLVIAPFDSVEEARIARLLDAHPVLQNHLGELTSILAQDNNRQLVSRL